MTQDLFEPVECIDPKSQKDIDDAVKNNPDYQRDFVWMAIRPDIRAEINKRWQAVGGFSEPNFINEFREKAKFYSRLWELNLRFLLLEQLVRKPGAGEPDILADSYVAECVVPAPTDVPELRLDGRLYDYPDEEIARRITTAINSKNEQLKTRLRSNQSRIDYTATPYVIALCLPESNYMSAMGKSGMSIVEEMVMGIGPIQVTINSATNTATSSVSSRSTITTRNGSQIEIGYFQKEEYKDLSAVLWTTEYLPESRDLHVLLNPNANVSLEGSSLLDIVQAITYTKNSDHYSRNQPLI
ncbi:hypothetical protein DYH10_03745 [Candidatus Saccharibacteria bacterium CPR2]|nr:hypothetical protein [Candidatus Saccharibacteria bacterium CPR2]